MIADKQVNAPNLAAGAVLRSCLLNRSCIAVMDLAYQPGRVLAKVQEVHILSGGLGMLLLGMVAISALIGPILNGFGMFDISILSCILAQ